MSQSRKMDYIENDGMEPYSISERTRVAQEYNSMLDGFAVGDHGRVELTDGEQRAIVRNRLQAAARRRNLTLRFRPGPSAALIFRVDAAPEPVRPQLKPPEQAPQAVPSQSVAPNPPARIAAPARPAIPAEDRPPASGNRRSNTNQDRDTRRPYEERRPAAERYQKMLPRWMREGAQPGQRRSNDRRRRPR